jgi:hypothetical protein
MMWRLSVYKLRKGLRLLSLVIPSQTGVMASRVVYTDIYDTTELSEKILYRSECVVSISKVYRDSSKDLWGLNGADR